MARLSFCPDQQQEINVTPMPQLSAETTEIAQPNSAPAPADVTVKQPEPELLKPDGTPTPLGWKRIGAAFRAEMPTKTRTGKGGKTFEYITARQVAARLDAVVGPGNWASSVDVIRAEHPVSVVVGIGVFNVWRHDVGYSNNPDADDEADRGFEDEPLKAAVSDGLKRAAVQWGIARWLYP